MTIGFEQAKKKPQISSSSDPDAIDWLFWSARSIKIFVRATKKTFAKSNLIEQWSRGRSIRNRTKNSTRFWPGSACACDIGARLCARQVDQQVIRLPIVIGSTGVLWSVLSHQSVQYEQHIPYTQPLRLWGQSWFALGATKPDTPATRTGRFSFGTRAVPLSTQSFGIGRPNPAHTGVRHAVSNAFHRPVHSTARLTVTCPTTMVVLLIRSGSFSSRNLYFLFFVFFFFFRSSHSRMIDAPLTQWPHSFVFAYITHRSPFVMKGWARFVLCMHSNQTRPPSSSLVRQRIRIDWLRKRSPDWLIILWPLSLWFSGKCTKKNNRRDDDRYSAASDCPNRSKNRNRVIIRSNAAGTMFELRSLCKGSNEKAHFHPEPVLRRLVSLFRPPLKTRHLSSSWFICSFSFNAN